MLTPAEIAAIAAKALEDKKARDVTVLKTAEQTVLADYFVICSGTSAPHVKALVDEAGVYPADTQSSADALTEPPAFFSNQPDFYTTMAAIATTARSFTFGPNVNVAYSAYNDSFGKACEARTSTAFTDAVQSMQTTTVDDMRKSGFSVSQ